MLENLFSKGKIASIESKNRIVMTAMGNHLANADGTVSEADLAFYGARAKGGVGIIFTECAYVDTQGKGNNCQISVENDNCISGLEKLANEVHQYGSKIVVQIYHPGRQGISAINGNEPMLAPSSIECQTVHQPTRAMTKEEIVNMIEKFVDGALRVKKAGIDGVEIHAAHGYLINQFLSSYTNHRTDDYGGNFKNRIRFLEAIIKGIRKKCGKEFPIIVRLTVDEFLDKIGLRDKGLKLKDGVKIAKYLEELGVDAINVTSGIYESMNVAWEPSSFEQGWKIYLSETIKKSVNIPVIGVSVIRDPEYADQIIKEQKVDFVGSARQHYADPEWSNKAKAGRFDELRRCISCLYCMQTLMEADISGTSCQCSINIKAGQELTYNNFKKDGDGRTVVIIGAGPSGLEAARILAKRGFKPVIFEKSSKLGGQLKIAKKPPKKDKINWLIEYLRNQVKKYEVEIHLNTRPVLEDLVELNPYAVFIAQGSNPIIPDNIPGVDNKEVLTCLDILNGDIKLTQKKIAVIGSGMTGLETAHLLAEEKNQVSVFEMDDSIGGDLYFQNLIDHLNYLNELNVDLYPNHKLIKIDKGKASFENTKENLEKSFDFDFIILSLGRIPDNNLVSEIKQNFNRVKILGDAFQVGKIRNAVEAGFKEAYNL
ncbi:FAD-dependent oxidoreductase [Halocella sp. SP3-1]|uniref:oxidoreductase n=1 Tax=Halocella sp. SP3-1 TaxID=2382161 RepID=UPI000F75233A|nr:FAD-dependent oxidoreductase [Halocella sp. SP3-1]AZO96243.1 NADH:flavin oxidoreductase [Halocella sp. SP3-1]